MARFYFHVHSNGILAEDRVGREFNDQEQARAHAVRDMPRLLRQALQATSAYVTTEIFDGARTVCVVRGTIVSEMR